MTPDELGRYYDPVTEIPRLRSDHLFALSLASAASQQRRRRATTAASKPSRAGSTEVCADVLANEVWVEVLQHLGMRDLLSFSATSRRFAELARTDALWRRHYARLFRADGRPLHLGRVTPQRCTLDLVGAQICPDTCCRNSMHYVRCADGVRPQHDRLLFEHTAQRLHELLRISAGAPLQQLEPGLSRRYMSDAERADTRLGHERRCRWLTLRFETVLRRLLERETVTETATALLCGGRVLAG